MHIGGKLVDDGRMNVLSFDSDYHRHIFLFWGICDPMNSGEMHPANEVRARGSLEGYKH